MPKPKLRKNIDVCVRGQIARLSILGILLKGTVYRGVEEPSIKGTGLGLCRIGVLRTHFLLVPVRTAVTSSHFLVRTVIGSQDDPFEGTRLVIVGRSGLAKTRTLGVSDSIEETRTSSTSSV